MSTQAGTLDIRSNDVFALIDRLIAGFACNMSAVEENRAVGDALSDSALVESIVLRGNQSHFCTLLARYKLKVHHIVLSVLGPSLQSQAEDVAQEVFIKLYLSLNSFRGDCLFSTWLYRLAINTAIDYQRKHRKFEAQDFDQESTPGSSISATSVLAAAEVSVRIKRAVQSLPQSQRIMVHLFYWLGFKIREIAEVMDCPEGTVKVYLQRARKHLAYQLRDHTDA